MYLAKCMSPLYCLHQAIDCVCFTTLTLATIVTSLICLKVLVLGGHVDQENQLSQNVTRLFYNVASSRFCTDTEDC